MHLRTFIFILQTIIVIPSVIIYVIEIIILLTTKGDEFTSPFYTLFICCGITDICGVILSHFFYALPMAVDIADIYVSSLPIWSFTTANALLFYLPTVQDFLNIAIAMNRWSAMMLPFIYKSIWSPYRSKFVIFLCFVLGFGPSYIIFASPATFIQLSVGSQDPPVYLLYPLTLQTFPKISRTLLVGITLLTCNGISAVINLMTAMKLFITNTNNVAERKLLFLGITIFLTNFPAFSYQLYFFLNPSTTIAGYVVQCLPWIFIFKSLIHPFLLLFTNASIRHIILRRSKWSKSKENTVTILH